MTINKPPYTYDFWPYRYIWFYKFQPFVSNGYYGKVFSRAVSFSAFLLAVFIGIASYDDFLPLLLSIRKSWPIYLGLAGFAVFIFLAGVLAPLCYATLVSLRPLFQISGDAYNEHIDSFVRSVLYGPRIFLLGVVPALLFTVFSNVMTLTEGTMYHQDKDLMGLIHIMPSSLWYYHASLPKLIIPDIVAIITTIFVVFTVLGFVSYIQLMRVLGGLNFASLYVVPVAALRFRKLTTFNFTLSICYSIGVLLIFSVASWQSRYSLAVLVALGMMSVFIVALPYLYFSRKLRLELDVLIDHLLSASALSKGTFGSDNKDLQTMLEVVALIKDLPTGIYELRLGIGNAVVTTLIGLAVGYLKLQ